MRWYLFDILRPDFLKFHIVHFMTPSKKLCLDVIFYYIQCLLNIVYLMFPDMGTMMVNDVIFDSKGDSHVHIQLQTDEVSERKHSEWKKALVDQGEH